jgi:hypothetical protein
LEKEFFNAFHESVLLAHQIIQLVHTEDMKVLEKSLAKLSILKSANRGGGKPIP